MHKELRDLIRDLEAHGFTVERRKSHYVVSKDGQRVTTLSATPSDWRTRRNELAPAYRMGLRKPRERGQKGKAPKTSPDEG